MIYILTVLTRNSRLHIYSKFPILYIIIVVDPLFKIVRHEQQNF